MSLRSYRLVEFVRARRRVLRRLVLTNSEGYWAEDGEFVSLARKHGAIRGSAGIGGGGAGCVLLGPRVLSMRFCAGARHAAPRCPPLSPPQISTWGPWASCSACWTTWKVGGGRAGAARRSRLAAAAQLLHLLHPLPCRAPDQALQRPVCGRLHACDYRHVQVGPWRLNAVGSSTPGARRCVPTSPACPPRRPSPPLQGPAQPGAGGRALPPVPQGPRRAGAPHSAAGAQHLRHAARGPVLCVRVGAGREVRGAGQTQRLPGGPAAGRCRARLALAGCAQ